MHRKSSRIKYFIAAAIALLSLLGGFLASVASNEVPEGVKPYLSWAWPLLGIVAIAIIAFTIWQARRLANAEPPLPALNSQNRQRMLSRVYNFWIKGVFEQSLHGAALIALGLNEQQDALANPWHLVILQPDDSVRSLPSGTRITEVYDDADGELLILGDPGSGKTTMLLELTRDLIERAKKDDTYPIPVVFNLSSWPIKHRPLSEWLVEELNTKYQVPLILGQSWVNTDQILPLLDGLDEVAKDHREACMITINDYHKQHLTSLVVCSRSSEYMAQSTHLLLSKAVKIQNLTEKQIDAYLWSAGGQLEALRIALHDDPELLKLAETPLMLSVLALAYQGKSIEDLLIVGNAGARRKQIFKTYTQHMLQRRGLRKGYTEYQTIHYLTWLAKQLVQHNQTEFYIERMQPDWLPKNRLYRLYLGISNGFVCGLIIGLCFGVFDGFGEGFLDWLIVGLITGLVFALLGMLNTKNKSTKVNVSLSMRIRRSLNKLLRSNLFVGIFLGMASGLIAGLVNGLNDGWGTGLLSGLTNGIFVGLAIGLAVELNTEIKPAEVIAWSWVSMRRSLVRFVALVLITVLVFVLIASLYFSLRYGLLGVQRYGLLDVLLQGLYSGLRLSLFYGMLTGSILGLIAVLTNGLSNEKLDERYIVKPNQGIWNSARNGVFAGLIVGLVVGLVVWIFIWLSISIYLQLVYGEFTSPYYNLSTDLSFGLSTGFVFGLAAGLYSGGTACIKHIVLRLLLWYAGYSPLNYPRFLDYAAKCILLRKVGGGYIFVHRFLLEYFASLDNTADKPESAL